MSSSFALIKKELEEKLKNSAFRGGTNAFRFGLIPQGISDHLPITAIIERANYSLRVMSWNLLADTHLYNNFHNVSGIQYLADAMSQQHLENIYFNSNENKLFYFFAEIAQYLYKTQTANLDITEKLLEDFISIENQNSNLTRSLDIQTVEEKSAKIETARAEILHLLKNPVHRHEFDIMIKHSLEIIYHIQNPNGALQWKNRFDLLQKNTALVNRILEHDFICLQECSEPDDILKLFQTAQKPHQLLSHRIHEHTTDHCVLIYDAAQFSVTCEPIKSALENKKPYILAKFQDRRSKEQFIVASIHHSGGMQDFRDELLQQVELLQEPNKIPFYMLGDFNHTAEEFLSTSTAHMIYPTLSTMAGSDYNNTNKAVDAVLCATSNSIKVERVVEILASPPSDPPPVTIKLLY